MNCRERLWTEPASRAAVVAFVVALVGLQLGLLPAAVGGVLGRRELARTDAGRAPERGRELALGAFWLGRVGLVPSLLVGAWYLSRS